MTNYPRPDCKPRDRIRLIQMGPDPCPIPPGATGTVRAVYSFSSDVQQIRVSWDSHRSLMLIWPTDKFEVIERPMDAFFKGDANGLDC